MTKLLSNSYQAGFENIKHDIEMQEVYQILKKDKLNDKLDVTDLEKRLIDFGKIFKATEVQGNIYYEKHHIYVYQSFLEWKKFFFTNKCEEKYARGV